MRKTKSVLIVLFILVASGFIYESEKDEVVRYEYEWLAGRWTGDGFGGTSETVWTPPSKDGTMIGAFRLYDANGKPTLYQFLVLNKESLRIKHFYSNLKGWEEKEGYVTFKALEFSKNKITFEGLTYERKSKNEQEIRLQVNRDGKISTEVFHKKRAD